MPFRVPAETWKFNSHIQGQEPDEDDLVKYVAWLEKELSIAKHCLELMQKAKTP